MHQNFSLLSIANTLRGIMSSCMAAVKGWKGAMALRFLLGMFEAGYGPGIPYLLSFFYLRHEVGLRIGFFLAAAPLANTFSGALAYGITSGKHTLINNWRILFLVEGLPTICVAPIVFFFLPDSPHQARFLNEEERRVAAARGVRQAGAENRVGSVNLKEVLLTLLDVKAWLTAVSVLRPTYCYSDANAIYSSCISLAMLASLPCQSFCRPFLTIVRIPYLAITTY
jgi:MFS family permease